MAGCQGGSAASTDPADGDNPADQDTDGASSDTLGKACASDADCVNSECLQTVRGLLCLPTCTSTTACAALGADFTCEKLNGTYYCLPGNAGDGDSEEADTTSDSDACHPDSDTDKRCGSASIVQLCDSSSKTWKTYKYCSSDAPCINGECVKGACTPTGTDLCCGDQYRCRGLYEVQNCVGGQWAHYRDCQGGMICSNADCIDYADGDSDSEEADTDSESEAQGVVCSTNPSDSDYGCADDDLEYCFVRTTGATEGHCTPYCGAGQSCPDGFSCNSKMCKPIEGYCTSSGQCAATQYCNIFVGNSEGICVTYCFVVGQHCPHNATCMNDSSDINYGKCVSTGTCNGCSADGECATGYYCDIPNGSGEGCCVERCGSTNPCAGGLNCKDGRCVVGNGLNECTTPCSTGQVCDTRYGVCVSDCPLSCLPNYYCDNTSGGKCVYDPDRCTEDSSKQVFCGFGLAPCCGSRTCNVLQITYGAFGYCN